MSGTQESGAFLGGIGVMLEVSNVCLACGQVHDGRKFGLKHSRLRECPRVVMGSFPLVSLPSPPEVAPVKVPPVRAPSTRKGRKTNSRPPAPLLLGNTFDIVRASPETGRGRALGGSVAFRSAPRACSS